jgi:hypothetical protein
MLPASARPVAVAITDAVTAAGDAVVFEAATARLVSLDREQVRLLLGTVVRLLLEESHPGGVDGDALRDVLSRVVSASAEWFDAEPSVVAYVLLGAVGATDPDTDRPPPATTLLAHAAAVTAELLRTSPRPLPLVLTDAFADLYRAETLDYFS